MEPDLWSEIRSIRYAVVGEGAHVTHEPSQNMPSEPVESSEPRDDGGLSTIPEERSEDLRSVESLFQVDPDPGDDDFRKQLEEAGKQASYWCLAEDDAPKRCL